MPHLSIILPCYNAERYLAATMLSIGAQTYRDFEFVIVNDGSTDNSQQVLESFAKNDHRIKVISRPNTGYVKALREAIEKSTGRLIARMDADDIAKPDRLAKQVAFMEAHPEVVVLGGSYNLIDSEGRRLRTMNQPTDHDTLVQQCLGGTTPICHPLSMFRRDVYERVGGYDESTCPAEDLDLWLRMSEVGQLACLPDVLLDYRLHAGSVSETKQAKQMEAIHSIVERAARRRNITVDFKAGEGWRAHSAEGRHKQLLKYGWWAWSSGERATARSYGWRSVVEKPVDIRAWKLLVTSILKRAPGRAQ